MWQLRHSGKHDKSIDTSVGWEGFRCTRGPGRLGTTEQAFRSEPGVDASMRMRCQSVSPAAVSITVSTGIVRPGASWLNCPDFIRGYLV